MRKRGLFITLEGTDGVGKTTQGRLLANWLMKQGLKVVHTREPGGGAAAAVGERIRHLLLDPKIHMSPLTELMLYEAARAEHMDKVIQPALKTKKVVLCDRFTDSTLAYQGYARGLELSTIQQLNKIASRNTEPDLTILLDLPVERGLRNARKRSSKGDRLENEGANFQKKVRKGFLSLAKRHRNRIKLIRVQPTVEKTQELIQKAVKRKLK